MPNDTYYDVDAILNDSQKIPTTFELNVPGLGWLDGGKEGSGDIKQGAKMSLPLWLAEMLAVSTTQKPLITLDLPPCLSPLVMNALKADPKTVDLRSLATHFYLLGARILDLFEEEDIVNVLSDSFKTRAKAISDHAANVRGAAGSTGGMGIEFLRGLDEWERQLFRAAHDDARETRRWLESSGKM